MNINCNKSHVEIENSIEEQRGLHRIEENVLTDESIIESWFSPLKKTFLVTIIKNHLIISNHAGIWAGFEPLKMLKQSGRIQLEAI